MLLQAWQLAVTAVVVEVGGKVPKRGRECERVKTARAVQRMYDAPYNKPRPPSAPSSLNYVATGESATQFSVSHLEPYEYCVQACSNLTSFASQLSHTI